MTPIIGGLIDTALKVLDKVLPDPQAKIQAQLELMRLQQAGEFKVLEADLQLALAQTKINEIEAAAPDVFRGGWRPAAGWVCVAGLGYQFLFQPLAAWSGGIQGWPPPPVLDLGDLYGLLFGMLGLGAYRSFEKTKGKA
jgi:Holin of 3TMs, for gene-transfer release